MTLITRRAKDTLTAVEMDEGDIFEFELTSGRVVRIRLLHTQAEVIHTTLKRLKLEESAAVTNYRFGCAIELDGKEYSLEREVATQRSFYEPWEMGGVRLWLDCVDRIFDFLCETHGWCRTARQEYGPNRSRHKHARFAIQDETLRICPEYLHPWCPLPEGGLRIEDCYRGEDCWLGAYNGASAHGGLDVNHPRGTPLWAPLDIHEQFYFESVAAGHDNNRWRGIHRWENGSQWILQAHHMTGLTVSEHQPVAKGRQFANGAGVPGTGAADHSHFVFKIHDSGETIPLDPWILFWQMYRDLEAT